MLLEKYTVMSKNMSQNVQLCSDMLHRCIALGILQRSRREQWESFDAFKLASWQGDGVLSGEMRSHIHKKFAGEKDLGYMAKTCKLSINYNTLAELYDQLSLNEVPGTSIEDSRARGDTLEEIFRKDLWVFLNSILNAYQGNLAT